MKLSKSKINLYKQCPFKFKLLTIDNLREPEGPALIKGSAFHKVAEVYYKLDGTHEEKTKQLSEMAEYRLSAPTSNKFFQFTQRVGVEPLLIEIKFYDPELHFSGIIDAVFEYDNKVIILDYKTGKEHPLKDYRLELALYTYLFEKNYDKKVTHWGIYFADEDKFIGEKRCDQDILNAVEEVKEVRKLIQDRIFFKKKSWLCQFCSFKMKECNGINP